MTKALKRHECGARGGWVAALEYVLWGEEEAEHVVPHGLEHLCGGRPSRRVSKWSADGHLAVSARPACCEQRTFAFAHTVT